ncbi:cytochrome P450 [Nocardia callitridis]|uniref:Cytochrome P450 n=1 Tax=Nocardia callitridis TaxID=648753 RepID=A0ABP9K3Y1_9NOCA
MTTTEPKIFPANELDRLEPDPLFAELRADAPLSRIQLPYGEPGWLATRYEDIKVVLGDRRFSRAEATGRDEPRVRPLISAPGNILSVDPPEHSRLRRLVLKAFTARRMAELRPEVTGIAERLVDGMIERGAPSDLVADFALPLPITVICEMLGVPFEDRTDFRLWSDAFLSTTRFTPEEVALYSQRMRDYIAELVAQRRVQPQDDMLSDLVQARDEHDRLSEDELISMGQTILVAGHETTASQIPNFVYILLHHPDQLAQLRADPDLLPRAVEELMRFTPLGAAVGTARYATEDIEVGGVLVRAGEPVMAAVASGNRDESIFPDADVLDLRRSGAHHVGFGHGPHHCLGAPLARMELQVALQTLLERLPGLRIVDEESGIDWKTGMSTRGPERLLVTWDQP